MTHKPFSQLIIPFLLEHWFWSALFVVLVIAYIAFEIRSMKFSKYLISNSQLTMMMNTGSANILDIRPTEFFEKGHIKGSVSIEMDKILKENHPIDLPKDQPIVLISGYESDCLKSIAAVQKQGFTTIHVLAHGIQGWRKEKLPFTSIEKKSKKKEKKAKKKETAKNDKN